MALFQEGWGHHYDGMIDWIGPDFGGDIVSVDPDAMTVSIDGEVTKVDACNVIPAMKAGRICEMAGITEGNWAPVDGRTMQSRLDENIHVLGDACAQGDMPKSGFSAQFPGQGRGHGGACCADRFENVPGQVLQHLLVADRHG